MIRTLLAEDSPTARALLAAVLRDADGVELVGEAADGARAVELTLRLRPDVVVMDANMPTMDGFEATRLIMESWPVPIVIVSAVLDTKDVAVTMRALEAGALVAIPKPSGPAAASFLSDTASFVATVRAMAAVKVVRRFPTRRPARVPALHPARPRAQVVAIAASTGGPGALKRLLSELPADLAAPVLVVQHIASGFVAGFCQWLDGCTPLSVGLARDGEPLRPGTVRIAPDGAHLGVGAGGVVELATGPPVGGFRPSAEPLFRSAVRHAGPATLAVVLTGMGSDGLDGLHAVRAGGGTILAQSEESCVVFGMPGAAVQAGLAHATGAPEELAQRIRRLVRS